MQRLRTQVGIVGAGPAGLLLGHLLHLDGIDSVILEDRSRGYVIERVRAGVLEQGTVDALVEAGLGGRLQREGMRHAGIRISFDGRQHLIDFAALTGGRSITVYGQNEVVRDLIDARRVSGRPLHFEARRVRIADFDTAPRIAFELADGEYEMACDFIAGCDGSHGICRPSIPAARLRVYEREYPFAWLGILAQAAPSSRELVYALHQRGFALFSMRSPAVTRLYLQCAPEEDAARWSDSRIWDELTARLERRDGWRPNRGDILQKGVTRMRSVVVEPMRHGRLFLAGDAAHIVPPTGAKGLNLAVADVRVLARALAAYYRTGCSELLDSYSDRCLARVWRAQRFSWWMTSTLHRAPDGNEFDYRRQIAELEYATTSRAAMISLAENYAGWPLE
ncbi:MAG TPA: 4-hydroxybenzoate 3-monooxygenase [Bryobacteraceae bacterium]|nr:4-hydroxybenzoate 3-monooxygenase [Bryobacteraceae bacterium]